MAKKLTDHVYLTVDQKHDNDLPIYSLAIEVEYDSLMFVCDTTNHDLALKLAPIIEKYYNRLASANNPADYLMIVMDILHDSVL